MTSTPTGGRTDESGFWSVAGLAPPKGEEQRWDFERLIGEGGTGFVHQVFDRLMERRVALKILKPELAQTRHGRDLFLQEPRIAARLPHPHIVPIFEVGKHAKYGCFFTMELVQGQQLEEILLAPGTEDDWGPARALPLLDVFRKACDALAFAHSRGVVHADLKPDNIRVGEYGQVYLMDWGLARVVDSQVWGSDPVAVSAEPDLLSNPEVTPGFSGTPAYMAPEIVTGARQSRQSDIFAMGVTLYRLLTREPPFPGKNVRQVVAALRAGKFTDPRATPNGEWIPAELERIVLKAMALDPKSRYGDAVALAYDLRRLTPFGAHFPVVTLAPGERIAEAGEPPGAAYVILAGRCGVYGVTDGEEVLLDELGPGQILGEEAILLEGGVSPTSSAALVTTSASRLTRESAEHEISAMAPWVGTVLKALAERNRAAQAHRLRSHQAVGYLARKGPPDSDGRIRDGAGRLRLTRGLAGSRLLSAFAEGASPALLLDRTFDFIFESFRGIIPFDRIGVAMLEDDGKIARFIWVRQDHALEGIAPGFSAPLEDSSLKDIARTRRPRIIDDLREYLQEHPRSRTTRLALRAGIVSSLTCPLVVGDSVVGFLFFSSRQAGSYSGEHVEKFVRVADNISAVVSGARSQSAGAPYSEEILCRVGEALLDLTGTVEAARDEVRFLAEVARRSCRGESLNGILDYIFEAFGDVVPFDRIGYASLEDEGRVAHARWSRSHGGVIGIDVDYQANIESSSLREVLASGCPRIIDDLEQYLREHPDSESTRLILKEGIRSSLTCPLVSMGKPVGFLFFSSRQPRAYEPAHVEAFLRITDQLAIVVERADLNRALQEAHERIAALEE